MIHDPLLLCYYYWTVIPIITHLSPPNFQMQNLIFDDNTDIESLLIANLRASTSSSKLSQGVKFVPAALYEPRRFKASCQAEFKAHCSDYLCMVL